MIVRLGLVLFALTCVPVATHAGGRAEKRARNQLEMRNPIPKDRITRKVLRESRQLGQDVEPNVRVGIAAIKRGFVWQDRGRKKDRRAYGQLRQRLRIAKLTRAEKAQAAEFFAEANRLGLALVGSDARTTPKGTRIITLEYMTPIQDPRVSIDDGMRSHEITLTVRPGGEQASLTIARHEQ